jgi:hypothetical protein
MTIVGKGKTHGHPATTPHITIPGKPKPREETYRGCPAWGRGGDPLLSLLKNRTDRAQHPRVLSITQMLHLPWPSRLTQVSLPMENWSHSERKQVDRYEGSPASVIGYMTSDSTNGPPEDANCAGKAGYDWHIWIGQHPRDSRKQSAIAEATPRVRAREHGFTAAAFHRIGHARQKVRVTGWLFLDTDHPLSQTDRATLWEVHPITRLDVWQPKRCQRHHRHCVKAHWRQIAG